MPGGSGGVAVCKERLRQTGRGRGGGRLTATREAGLVPAAWSACDLRVAAGPLYAGVDGGDGGGGLTQQEKDKRRKAQAVRRQQRSAGGRRERKGLARRPARQR